MAYNLLVHVAGILMLLGVLSIVYNQFAHKVTSARKPLYWLAGPMAVTLFGIYVNFVVNQVWSRELIPQGSVRIALVVVFFILGVLLCLVPYVDRVEHDQILRAMESEGP